MLATFLAHVGLQTVSMEIPGRPLFEVLAKLEPLANEKLLPSAEIKHLPIILRDQNQPWSQVKKQIAWATWATWVEREGKWILERTKANRDAYALAQVERRKHYLTAFFEGVVKRAEASGNWKKEAAVGQDQTDREFTGNFRANTWRLIAGIGENGVAQSELTIWCSPARSNETPFPSACQPILNEVLAEVNASRRRAELTVPKKNGFQLATQVVLIKDGVNSFSLMVADQFGKVVASFGDSVAVGSLNPVRLAKSMPVALSALTLSWADARQIRPTRTINLTPELQASLLDPVKTDPTELYAGPVFTEIGKGLDVNVVATIAPPSTFRLVRLLAGPLRSTIFLNALQNYNEVDVTSNWLRSRPIVGDIPTAIDRAILKQMLSAAWNAKGDDERANALFVSQGFSVEALLETMGSAFVLFPGSEIAGDQAPMIRLFDRQRESFRKMVRLSQEEQRAVEAVFRDRMMSVMPANVTKLDPTDRPTGALMSGGLETNLSFLPTRLYPNGIPADIEIEFEPAVKSGPTKVRMAFTESMEDAKLIYPSSYAIHLRELNAGSITKAYKWFASPGSAGGKIIYRIPGIAEVEINASVFATSPSPKGRPVSELPDGFLQQVKYYEMMLPTGQGGVGRPPPRKLRGYTN